MLKENICHLANFFHYYENNNLSAAKAVIKYVMIEKIRSGWTAKNRNALNFSIKNKTFGPLSSFFDDSCTGVENIVQSFDQTMYYLDNIYPFRLTDGHKCYYGLRLLCWGWNAESINNNLKNIVCKSCKPLPELRCWYDAGSELFNFCINYKMA